MIITNHSQKSDWDKKGFLPLIADNSYISITFCFIPSIKCKSFPVFQIVSILPIKSWNIRESFLIVNAESLLKSIDDLVWDKIVYSKNASLIMYDNDKQPVLSEN